jgi:predicted transcriptional regulator
VRTLVISDHNPNTIVKILETALASKGATLTKLVDNLELTEYPDKLKMYLSILEDNRLIAYHKGDGVYRTTYKGMHFLRTYNQSIDLLSHFENEYKK